MSSRPASRKGSHREPQETRRMDIPHPAHEYAIASILNTFRPAEVGLDSNFNLLNYTELKGCGCKMVKPVLEHLLKAFGTTTQVAGEVGIGLDSCVVPLRHAGLSLVQTTDFFFPLVNDPYIMGRITAANVLSDLYAMGVTECDNMLMLLGLYVEFNDVQRDVVAMEFIRGFKDTAELAGTKVRGGQTVRCRWLLFGGVATSVVTEDEMLKVDRAVPGDVLILTKPLGGQVAVNVSEWFYKKDPRVFELNVDTEKAKRAVQQAMEQMCRLNRNAAICARKYNVHACTDVTGFGIFGHAETLAKAQKAKVNFVIDTMPVIEYMEEIARAMSGGNGFNLFSGRSAETSGGLLLAMPEDVSQLFREDLEAMDGHPTFRVGEVVATEGDRGATIAEHLNVVNVPSSIHSLALQRELLSKFFT